MKLSHISFLLSIFCLTGCFHQSRENMYRKALRDYTTLEMRYEEMLDICERQEIIEKARLLGIYTKMTLWGYISQSLLGNEYLLQSESIPLHRALYFMKEDSELLDTYLYYFERHDLHYKSLYEKMMALRHALVETIKIIESDHTFVEESKFIESHRLQKYQLEEQEKQTELLKRIAHKEEHKRSDKKTVFIEKIEAKNVHL